MYMFFSRQVPDPKLTRKSDAIFYVMHCFKNKDIVHIKVKVYSLFYVKPIKTKPILADMTTLRCSPIAWNTEIGKKAWLFTKLLPGRARKRIDAT